MNQKFYSLNFILLFILLILFSFQSKAIALATLPSTLSDTCVEISLKSGKKIAIKITAQTKKLIYFKKCDESGSQKLYSIEKETIEDIKLYSIENNNKTTENQSEEAFNNKKKQNRISLMLILAILSLLLLYKFSPMMELSIFTIALFLLFVLATIIGTITTMNYPGRFKGKIFVHILFVLGAVFGLTILFRALGS